MTSFTSDVEFIQFLKSISLFVTTDDKASIGVEPAQMDGTTDQLYKNLEFLRQRFHEYKYQKQRGGMYDTLDRDTSPTGQIISEQRDGMQDY